MLCANCGGYGHMYRICSQPISSFGIICYRHRVPLVPLVPASGRGGALEYMMVQRKDSLSFVEFIRGKYNVQNRGYMLRLFGNMTSGERERIATESFDSLWHGFWQCDHNRSFMKEYEQSKSRFTMLCRGYMLRPPGSSADKQQQQQQQQPVLLSLAVVLASTVAKHDDTEFGFPKGRRNINESNIQCALREFAEETGVLASDASVLPDCAPVEEVFTGSNNVRYQHIYFLAELRSGSRAWADIGTLPVSDPVQLREVKAVGWFDAAGVLARIRPENAERREMFKRVHAELVASTGSG